jgi:hypothetical protein
MQGWTRIAKAVNADSRVANRVIYDVLNEPDAFGLKFEPKGGKPGMRDLYLKSFDAIYAVNPGGLASVAWQGRFAVWAMGICMSSTVPVLKAVCCNTLIRCAPELC